MPGLPQVSMVTAFLCLAISNCIHGQATERNSRPNILFIISDDHRWDCIGVAGNPSVQTPNLDALARDGVYFKQATIHTPQCSPCRASLITGLPPHQSGWYSNQTQERRVAANNGFSHLPTLPGELQKAGYQTVLVGKWHLRPDPWNVGFSEVRTWLPGGGGPYKDVRLAHGNSRETTTSSGFLQEVFGQDAEAFIRSSAAKEKPFFMWLALTAPHTPLKPNPERLEALYKDKSNAELAPPGFARGTDDEQLTSFTTYAGGRKGAKAKNASGEEDSTQPRAKRARRNAETDWHHYYTAISLVDEQVGRLRKALKETQLDRDTVVVFLGDNGLMRGSRGWEGKVLPYDESVRVPMIMYVPADNGIKGESPASVSSADLSPTFLKLAGVSVPDSWPGRDLRPVLKGARATGFEHAVCEFADNGSAKFGAVEYRLARTPESKLIRWRDPAKGEEFFDLKTDPRELHNQISNPKYHDQVSQLRSKLSDWQKRTNDNLSAEHKDVVTGEGED